jgi:hypothetical protein
MWYHKKNLINFMELSPPWQANSSSDIYEIPNILWNLKVHYPVRKSLPLVSLSLSSQMNRVHSPTLFI